MDQIGTIWYPVVMTMTLYNTLSRRKERFEPLDPTNVRLYVCGPTVALIARRARLARC